MASYHMVHPLCMNFCTCKMRWQYFQGGKAVRIGRSELHAHSTPSIVLCPCPCACACALGVGSPWVFFIHKMVSGWRVRCHTQAQMPLGIPCRRAGERETLCILKTLSGSQSDSVSFSLTPARTLILVHLTLIPGHTPPTNYICIPQLHSLLALPFPRAANTLLQTDSDSGDFGDSLNLGISIGHEWVGSKSPCVFPLPLNF